MTTTMNNEFERTKSVLIGVDNVDDIDLSDDDNGEPVFSLKKYEEEERAQFQEFQANYQDILLDRYISTIENRTEKLVSRNVAAVNDFVNGLSKKRALEKARDTTEEAQPKAPARIWLIPTKSALPEVYPVTELPRRRNQNGGGGYTRQNQNQNGQTHLPPRLLNRATNRESVTGSSPLAGKPSSPLKSVSLAGKPQFANKSVSDKSFASKPFVGKVVKVELSKGDEVSDNEMLNAMVRNKSLKSSPSTASETKKVVRPTGLVARPPPLQKSPPQHQKSRMCHFASSCRRPECNFAHTFDEFQPNECRYPACNSDGCKFFHKRRESKKEFLDRMDKMKK